MSIMCSTLQNCSSFAAATLDRGGRQRPAVDGLLACLILVMLLRGGEALAGESTPPAAGDFKLALHPAVDPMWHPAALSALPNTYRAPELPIGPLFPTDTFRPRGRSVLEKDTTYGAPAAATFIPGTTVWQRLSEYRVRDRVRVLTLWETGGNSVSLQADHRGDPTLQWTSRMSRSGGNRGVLDELFTKSLGAVMGRGTRETPRTTPEAAKVP